MPLTHVCMWSERKWIPITAEEATVLHPGGTVSAHSGLFMCELCGQYVTLTDGMIRDRYFRHSSEEVSKDCPERTFGTNASSSFKAGVHSLPIRLKITEENLFFEIGLIPLPDFAYNRLSGKSINIVSSGWASQKYIYSAERIQQGLTTYLNIGSRPELKYIVSVTPDDPDIKNYWSTEIDGISSSGALFDSATGKKLAYDADVSVNHSYLLLTSQRLYKTYKSVNISKPRNYRLGYNNWYLYEVIAVDFCEDAAKFFLNYHCRLTENTVEIIPLWPVYIKSPYFILHKDDYLTAFLRGNAEPKVFPETFISKSGCENGKMIRILCRERQQLLSAGRTKVLEYTYLQKDPLDQVVPLPCVSIKDLVDNEIVNGEHNEKPKNGTLIVKAPFDGKVIITADDRIVNKIELSAEQSVLIDNINFGCIVSIYQGCDLVWTARFFKEKKAEKDDDKKLFKTISECSGERIPISHSTGAIAAKMKNNYPLSKRWLSEQIRNGEINEKAYKILLSHHF